MDFRILGPLEVRDGDREVRLRGGKERALLALLLVNVNRTLAIDRIVDGLWGDDVPETAQKMVQIYVSHLRKVLPADMPRTRPPGYALVLEHEQLDLHRFDTAVAEARAALDAGEAQRAADRFRKALSLWRGPALTEFASEPFAQAEGTRLEERRVHALEGRLEAELALGHHGAAVGELEALIAQHPLRERLRSQHMLALYRSGRHAEALASYQAFRRTLAEELGIEPSASLRELERQMLQQDPSSSCRRARRRRAAVSGPGVGTGGAAPVGDVSYARSGDIRIAYQVVGDGPVDLVLVHGWVCTFQPGWEYPKLAAFYRRLASMGRLILFDKRGTGLSDRVSRSTCPTWRRAWTTCAQSWTRSARAAVLAGRLRGRSDVGALRRHLSPSERWRSSSWAPSRGDAGAGLPVGRQRRGDSVGAWPSSRKRTGRPAATRTGSGESPRMSSATLRPCAGTRRTSTRREPRCRAGRSD